MGNQQGGNSDAIPIRAFNTMSIKMKLVDEEGLHIQNEGKTIDRRQYVDFKFPQNRVSSYESVCQIVGDDGGSQFVGTG